MVIRVSDKKKNYSKVTKLLVKPMFIPTSRENEIRAFFENAMSSDTDLAKIQRKFINTLISLDKEEWIVLDRFMKKYHFNQK